MTSVGQLARADPADLAGRFGPTMGPWYRAVALAAGSTEVSAEPYVAHSRSRETTFQRDIVERAELDEQLVVLARRVAQDVAAEGRPAVRVGVKVRFAPFFTQTRSLTLPAPTTSAEDITASARMLPDRFEPGRPVRLLGVRAEFDRASGTPGSADDDHRAGGAVAVRFDRGVWLVEPAAAVGEVPEGVRSRAELDGHRARAVGAAPQRTREGVPAVPVPDHRDLPHVFR